MAQVFISHVEENADLAAELAHELEDAGLTTWYYGRDSLPGLSYLKQIAMAVEDCQAVAVIISPESIKSEQVDSEIIRGFELGKAFVPLLQGITHKEFQKKQPEWRGALRAATSVQIPQEGLRPIVPRILRGLQALGITRPEQTQPAAQPSLAAQLTATFDREAYPQGEDSRAYCLVELVLRSGAEHPDQAVDVDLALVLDVSGSMDKPNRYPLLREAVRRLLAGLDAGGRVSITLFSDRAEPVIALISADEARERADELIRRMNGSKLLFGPKTTLAPGLQLALAALGPAGQSAGRVRRVYVLTDGELHDTPACETVLAGFRPARVEVQVYGFGDEFNAAALKHLVSDQLGGMVKPICEEADIVRTFEHVADVNRKVVGNEGKLTMTFSPEVVCGDAWVFRPKERPLGTIQGRRLEHLFGALEAGRTYSLLVEVRLPPDEKATKTRVASVRADWVTGLGAQGKLAVIEAARGATLSAALPPAQALVQKALQVLKGLGSQDNQREVLEALQARRDLAVLEQRDPQLITVLDKLIKAVAAGKGMAQAKAELEPDERALVDSDPGTKTVRERDNPAGRLGLHRHTGLEEIF